MVGPGEVDNDLEPEVKEEMAKYGQVEKVLIYEVTLAFIDQFSVSYENLYSIRLN